MKWRWQDVFSATALLFEKLKQALGGAIDYVSVRIACLADTPVPMPEILTANRLSDGDVVYRAASGDWVADIDAAEVIDDAERRAAAEAAAQGDVGASQVVEVATIAVFVKDGHVVPKRLRERIRAFGPTVKSDHRPVAV